MYAVCNSSAVNRCQLPRSVTVRQSDLNQRAGVDFAPAISLARLVCSSEVENKQ